MADIGTTTGGEPKAEKPGVGMFDLLSIAQYFPSVNKPMQHPSFREKMKWTGIILVLFFLLGSISIWGVNSAAVAQFQFLEIVFGAKIGSVLTLGIGPIVTASIILQLFVGSKLVNWNLQDPKDKIKFTSTQKLLTIFFCFFEAGAYVLTGAIPPVDNSLFMITIVILQLAAGGILVMFMDEVVSKWGIGSGISLFIAAGVSKTIILRIFNPLAVDGTLPTLENPASGLLFTIFNALGAGQPSQALTALLPIISTVMVFAIVIFMQNIHVEIPMAFSLPFGRFGARKWPLKFFYTSNIPVILTAAVLANLQLLGSILYSRGITILGSYNEQGVATDGLMYLLRSPTSESVILVAIITGLIGLVSAIFLGDLLMKRKSIRAGIIGIVIGTIVGVIAVNYIGFSAITLLDGLHIFVYILAYVIGSTIFSIFWVNTAGMDAHSVAEQFKGYSIVIPGFRHDPRIIESILSRYIPVLTVLGGATIGLLAAYADITGALGTGTGILLTVMIIYQFYEQIMAQHSEDIPPSIKRILEGGV